MRLMPNDPRHAWIPGGGRLRWHGVALIVAGLLFGVRAILLYHLGRPPAGSLELVAWRRAHESTWAWLVEATAVAPVLLIPGLIGLWRALRQSSRAALAATGLGILAAAVPVILVLSLIGGRLAFAIYGIGLDDPTIVKFAVTTFIAGEHEVSLLIGAALLVLAGATRGTRLGGWIPALSAVAAVGLFVGAYPSVTGLGIPLAAGLLFASWLIAIGARLRLPATAHTHQSRKDLRLDRLSFPDGGTTSFQGLDATSQPDVIRRRAAGILLDRQETSPRSGEAHGDTRTAPELQRFSVCARHPRTRMTLGPGRRDHRH